MAWDIAASTFTIHSSNNNNDHIETIITIIITVHSGKYVEFKREREAVLFKYTYNTLDMDRMATDRLL